MTSFTQQELERMTDVEFKAVYLNHKECHKPWCLIARESFNRPRRFTKAGNWNPNRQPTLEPKFY